MGLILAKKTTETLYAIEFDGTSYLTEVGDYDRTTVDYTTTPFTNLQGNSFSWSMWVKPESVNNNNATSLAVESNIIMDGDLPGGAQGGSHIIGIANDNIIVGMAEQQSSNSLPGTYANYQATTDITDDAWHHLLLCYDASGQNLYFYVDGTREINQSSVGGDTNDYWWNASGSDADADIMEWGGEKGENTDDGGYFGRISEIICWNTVVASGATYTVPTSPVNPSTSGIVWMPDFRQGSGTSVTDRKGGPAMAVIEGGDPTAPRWVSDDPYA